MEVDKMKALIKHKLSGITSHTTYPSGELKDCKLDSYNEIIIGPNVYIPRYRSLDERKKDNKALAFYESGDIKSIALEQQMSIATPAGSMMAELVTFYEDGAMDSLFPLNGQIGFGWSEGDEEELLQEFECRLAFTDFREKIIGIRFYRSGKIKSIILWPKKNISIMTPLGEYPVRIGLRLYENGSLESFEPASAVPIPTVIGTIMAFDQSALGMDADYNSVRFNPDGSLLSLTTNSDIVVFDDRTGDRTAIYQQLKLEMLSSELMKLPVKIVFEDGQVSIDNGMDCHRFSVEQCRFLFLYDGSYKEKKCSPGSDCTGCGAACM